MSRLMITIVALLIIGLAMAGNADAYLTMKGN